MKSLSFLISVHIMHDKDKGRRSPNFTANKKAFLNLFFVDSYWFQRSVKEARADCGHCPLSNPQSDSSDPLPLIPARPAHSP